MCSRHLSMCMAWDCVEGIGGVLNGQTAKGGVIHSLGGGEGATVTSEQELRVVQS
jgi:hypothetical protein